jgi:phosphoglycolate phosphatase
MLVVFDLDGTLIDSVRDIADSANDMLVGYGADPLAVEVVGSMVGSGMRVLVGRALAARGIDVPVDEAVQRFRDAYDHRLTNHTRLYPGIAESMRVLAGRARLAVLTNKPEAPARRLLDAFELSGRFEWVIGGDGAFPRKPDPAGLQHLMREAAVPAAATVLVGDSPIDVETARRAGVRLCLARYGFGYRREQIETHDGDLIVDDARNLGAVLNRLLGDRSQP